MAEDNGDELKKPSLSDRIQVGIVILIALTLIVTTISVIDQVNYNKTILRPWVVPELSGKVVITKDKVYNYVFMSNIGETPAINLYTYGTVNNSKDFPVDTIKKKMQGFEFFKKAVLFPNQKQIKADLPTDYNLQNINRDEEHSLDVVRDLILNKDIYFHMYLIYESEDGGKYYLKESFKLKYLKETQDGIFVDWIFIWSSLESL